MTGGLFDDTLKGNDPERTIVTAALTGSETTRDHHSGIPYTPEEIAEEAAKAREAGAAQVHIHARTDEGKSTFSDDTYREIYERTRERTDIVINFSTGARGASVEDRVSYLDAARPEVAALNMGSMNYAKFSESREEFVFEGLFDNPFEDIRAFARSMQDLGIKPELECFDTGHVGNIRPLLTLGELERPIHFSLVMGVLGGIPATTTDLVNQVQHLPPDSTWQVIAIGRPQWRMVSAALSMGGNVRVGLEDNFYLPSGEKAADSAELVAKAVEMTRNVGREPATPAQARDILGLEPL